MSPNNREFRPPTELNPEKITADANIVAHLIEDSAGHLGAGANMVNITNILIKEIEGKVSHRALNEYQQEIESNLGHKLKNQNIFKVYQSLMQRHGVFVQKPVEEPKTSSKEDPTITQIELSLEQKITEQLSIFNDQYKNLDLALSNKRQLDLINIFNSARTSRNNLMSELKNTMPSLDTTEIQATVDLIKQFDIFLNKLRDEAANDAQLLKESQDLAA